MEIYGISAKIRLHCAQESKISTCGPLTAAGKTWLLAAAGCRGSDSSVKGGDGLAAGVGGGEHWPPLDALPVTLYIPKCVSSLQASCTWNILALADFL